MTSTAARLTGHCNHHACSGQGLAVPGRMAIERVARAQDDRSSDVVVGRYCDPMPTEGSRTVSPTANSALLENLRLLSLPTRLSIMVGRSPQQSQNPFLQVRGVWTLSRSGPSARCRACSRHRRRDRPAVSEITPQVFGAATCSDRARSRPRTQSTS